MIDGWPKQASCLECKAEGNFIIHTAIMKDLPDGAWSWHLLNHDKTSKFKFPKDFESKSEVLDFNQSLIDALTEDEEESNG